MAETTVNTSRGMGFLGWLTLIFIVLKINPGSHLDSPVEYWSWWLVLLPIWIVFAILIIAAIAFGVTVLVADMLDKRAAKKRRAERTARLKRP